MRLGSSSLLHSHSFAPAHAVTPRFAGWDPQLSLSLCAMTRLPRRCALQGVIQTLESGIPQVASTPEVLLGPNDASSSPSRSGAGGRAGGGTGAGGVAVWQGVAQAATLTPAQARAEMAVAEDALQIYFARLVRSILFLLHSLPPLLPPLAKMMAPGHSTDSASMLRPPVRKRMKRGPELTAGESLVFYSLWPSSSFAGGAARGPCRASRRRRLPVR